MFDPTVWVVRTNMQGIQSRINEWNEPRKGPKFFAGIYNEVESIQKKLNLVDNMSAYTFNLISDVLSILDDLRSVDVSCYESLREYHQDDSIEEKVWTIDAIINEIAYAEEEDADQNMKEVADAYEQEMKHIDDASEELSVYEAAEIWASNGKDSDYMFGYSEEELENALG